MEKSQAVLESVINSPLNVIIFALDRQYRYLAFNQSHRQTMKRIWGVDIAVGQSMLGFIKSPDDRFKARQNFDRVLAGDSFILEEEYGDTDLERRYYENIYNPIIDENDNVAGLTVFLTDITARKKLELEKEQLIEDLRTALHEVKNLSGLLPICANCKKIRDDKGYWRRVESYIQEHSEAQFSHSICPDCIKELYPQLTDKVLKSG